MGTHEDERTVLYITICVTKTYRYDVTPGKYHRITKYPKTIKVNFSILQCNVSKSIMRTRLYYS